MKRTFDAQRSLNALALAVVIVFAIMSYATVSLKHRTTQQAKDIDKLSLELTGTAVNQGYQPVTASVESDKVYFPELRLALPLTAESLALRYSALAAYKPGSNPTDPVATLDEATISTRDMLANVPDVSQQIDCSALVRIRFEAKQNPYSPSEQAAAEATLADGRNLEVYTENAKSCTTSHQNTTVSPGAIAALFKAATSY